MFNCFAISIGF